MENNTSFYGKQHVVLWKTSRHLYCLLKEGQKGRGSGVQDYLPPFILCGLLHLRSKNSVSPTEKGSEGVEALFTMNGEPLLLCGALRNIDNLCVLA